MIMLGWMDGCVSNAEMIMDRLVMKMIMDEQIVRMNGLYWVR